MKNLIKIMLSGFLLTAFLFSCKKEENKVYFEGGTAPVLTASSTANMVLNSANFDKVAVVFNWTNPEFKFNTGISSQDVTYILQVDTTGANFTNPKKQEAAIAKELRFSPTVKEFNSFFNKMELQFEKPHNIEFRIKATLANGTAVPIYSNVIKITVTPYLDAVVVPPGTASLGYTDGALYLVGSATNGGWNNPVPVPSQKFTKTDITHYSITVPLIGGQQYLMLPLNGDWSQKFGNACGSDGCNDAGGDNFKRQGDNFKGPAESGTYKISVNFLTGKFAVEKQ